MTTTNKFIGKMIFLFVGVLAFTACSPEDGKDGEQGPMGNANVIASDWITTSFPNNTTQGGFYIDDSNITQQIVDSGVVLAYGKYNNSEYNIALPFAWNNKSYYFLTHLGRVEFVGHSLNGITQNFTVITHVRYVIIPPSVSGGVENKTINKLYNGYTEEELRAMSYDEFVNVFELSVE